MKYLAVFILSFLFISCTKEVKTIQDENGIPVEVSESKNIKNRKFSLKGYSKIEFISYRGDRIIWDTIGKGPELFDKNLVINSKLNFDSTFIQERVVLNKTQEKELLNLMVCDTCEPEELAAACYMPRHLILFRNSKNRIIAYNEFCFECIGQRYSKNLKDFQWFCLGDMQKQFKNAGIKFFGDTPEQEKEESKFIDSIQKARGIRK
jgi:hypothetical protein